jgi:hypothetical protein
MRMFFSRVPNYGCNNEWKSEEDSRWNLPSSLTFLGYAEWEDGLKRKQTILYNQVVFCRI